MKRRNILIMIAAVVILGLGLSWGRISQAVTEDVKPRIALTFDDGPHPVYTPKLLDGLKERNVKATFFVVGKNIEGREDIIKRMDEEGHLIGNHTYDHVKITGLPEEEEQKLKSLRPDEKIPAWAFRFLQAVPGVKVVLSGMSNLEQLKDNLHTFETDRPLTGEEMDTLLSIMVSSYMIFIVTSLADTPFVYLARKISDKSQVGAGC